MTFYYLINMARFDSLIERGMNYFRQKRSSSDSSGWAAARGSNSRDPQALSARRSHRTSGRADTGSNASAGYEAFLLYIYDEFQADQRLRAFQVPYRTCRVRTGAYAGKLKQIIRRKSLRKWERLSKKIFGKKRNSNWCDNIFFPLLLIRFCELQCKYTPCMHYIGWHM